MTLTGLSLTGLSLNPDLKGKVKPSEPRAWHGRSVSQSLEPLSASFAKSPTSRDLMELIQQSSQSQTDLIQKRKVIALTEIIDSLEKALAFCESQLEVTTQKNEDLNNKLKKSDAVSGQLEIALKLQDSAWREKITRSKEKYQRLHQKFSQLRQRFESVLTKLNAADVYQVFGDRMTLLEDELYKIRADKKNLIDKQLELTLRITLLEADLEAQKQKNIELIKRNKILTEKVKDVQRKDESISTIDKQLTVLREQTTAVQEEIKERELKEASIEGELNCYSENANYLEEGTRDFSEVLEDFNVNEEKQESEEKSQIYAEERIW